MTNGGRATQYVADAAPPQAYVLRHLRVARDFRSMETMDVFRPLHEILVATLSETRKKSEFQMIVGVNQSRKNQVPFEVKAGFRRRRGVSAGDTADCFNTCIADVNLSASRVGGPECESRAPDSLGDSTLSLSRR